MKATRAAILILLLAPAAAAAAEPARWDFGLFPHYGFTVSRSLLRADPPLQAGYPHFVSSRALLDLDLERTSPRFRHRWTARLFLPAGVSSEDGSELGETLLSPEASRWVSLHLGWEPARRLRLGRLFLLEAGPAAGLFLEERKLVYLSGRTVRRREASFGLGPNTALEMGLGAGLALRAGFRGLFYLPWTGWGRIEYLDGSPDPYFQAEYRPFTYETAGELVLRWRAGERWQMLAGYRRLDWFGFGSRQPFDASDTVTWRLDCRDEVLLGAMVRLGAPGGAGRGAPR